MTPAGSLSLLLQQRCRDHLLAGLHLCYYCYKFTKVETHWENHFTFLCVKIGKVDLNFTSVHSASLKDSSSCQRLSTSCFWRDRPTQRLKMVLTCSPCCWRFLPVRHASAFFYKLRQNQDYRNGLCLLYYLHPFCICKVFLCALTTKGLKMLWVQVPIWVLFRSLNDDGYLSSYLSSGYFSGSELIFDHVGRKFKTSV